MKTRTLHKTHKLSARLRTMFLMLVSLSMFTISTATEKQDVDVFAADSTIYGIDQVATMTSETVTAPDGVATYKVSFDVTPSTGTSIKSGTTAKTGLITDWGINSDGETEALSVIFGTSNEWVESIANIQIVDFNANGGDLQISDITSIFLKSINIAYGNGKTTEGDGSITSKDAIALAANGGDTTDLGHLAANPTVVDLFTATASSDITTLTIGTGAGSANANKWVIRNITVEVSVDYSTEPSTISFDANGGSGTMADQSANIGSSVTLNENTYTKDGYYFYAWANSAAGTDFEATDAALYTPAEATETLYAVWKEIPAQAEVLELNDFDYSLIDGGLLSIDGYTGAGHDTTLSLYIPSTYVVGTEEYTVTELGNDAFLNKKEKITDLLLPNTLVSIGQKAIQSCYIESIVIPASVEVIGKWSFRGSLLLTEVVFDNGSQIDSIGPESFKGSSLLESIVLPSVRNGKNLMWYKDDTLMTDNVIYNADFLSTFTAEEGSPSSLNENSHNKEILTISPNPVSQSFTLNVEAVSSCIYNVSGQCVKQFPAGTSQFDISSLDRGMYFLKVVEANGHTSIEQLMKK